jgi:hypothetical protein
MDRGVRARDAQCRSLCGDGAPKPGALLSAPALIGQDTKLTGSTGPRILPSGMGKGSVVLALIPLQDMIQVGFFFAPYNDPGLVRYEPARDRSKKIRDIAQADDSMVVVTMRLHLKFFSTK